jgi:hypothetical protein
LWAFLPGCFFKNSVQIDAFLLFFAVVNFLTPEFVRTVKAWILLYLYG